MLIKKYHHLFFILFLFNIIIPHGFSGDTFIKRGEGDFWKIKRLVKSIGEREKHHVISYDKLTNQFVSKQVDAAAFSESNCYCRLFFNNDETCPLECTPNQLFYRVQDHSWVAAYALVKGDILLCANHQIVKLSDIELIDKKLSIYTLQVKDTHTFLVSKYHIVAHNMLVPISAAIGLSIPFNIGCGGATIGAIFGPIGICGGVVLGGVIGFVVSACFKERVTRYDVSFRPQTIAAFVEANNKPQENDGAKTKDKSSEEIKIEKLPKDGNFPFIPPKTKDGKIPKNKNGAYIDKKGNEWKWDNKKNEWDVSNKNGHWNVNIHGNQTHKGTHPTAQSHTTRTHKRGV